jgi:hypothetical protein
MTMQELLEIKRGRRFDPTPANIGREVKLA